MEIKRRFRMNINRSSIFWGMLLIGAGALALADQFGYIEDFSPMVWILVFSAISLVAFITYAMSGWQQWGWLFPAGIFGGLAVIIALTTNDVGSAAVGSPLFFGLLLPFAAAYLTDRTRNWWALIPGGIMLLMAMVTLLVDNVAGEWVGAMFLLMFGLAFLAVYLNNRTRIWALLVAYIFGVLSIAPMLASGGDLAAYFGPVFLLAVALPFFIVYFRSLENWWAIIPAGSLTVIAIIAAAAIAGLINDERQGGYVNAFMMAGLAATFAVVWLRHAKHWAKIVTVVLAALAVASVFFASATDIFWPIAIILGGIYLFYTALRQPKTA
jgi:hypothetical protein